MARIIKPKPAKVAGAGHKRVPPAPHAARHRRLVNTIRAHAYKLTRAYGTDTSLAHVGKAARFHKRKLAHQRHGRAQALKSMRAVGKTLNRHGAIINRGTRKRILGYTPKASAHVVRRASGNIMNVLRGHWGRGRKAGVPFAKKRLISARTWRKYNKSVSAGHARVLAGIAAHYHRKVLQRSLTASSRIRPYHKPRGSNTRAVHKILVQGFKRIGTLRKKEQ